MTIYIRVFENYCFELIFSDGKFKKKRLHLLINPSEGIHVLPTENEDDVRLVNPESITHLLCMSPSIVDEQMLERTAKLAEITNLPIITNKKSGSGLKNLGLSSRQLRVLGFEEEVIDDLSVDPVYMTELGGTEELITVHKKKKKSNPIQLFKKFGPKNIILTVTGNKKNSVEVIVDITNPLALVVRATKQNDILIPLDKRGLQNIEKIIDKIKPWTVLLFNKNIDFTFELSNIHNAVFFNSFYQSDELLIIPSSRNENLIHNTFLGGLGKFYEIP